MCEETKKEIITETFNKNVECMACDLASLKSIKEFTDKVNKSILILFHGRQTSILNVNIFKR